MKLTKYKIIIIAIAAVIVVSVLIMTLWQMNDEGNINDFKSGRKRMNEPVGSTHHIVSSSGLTDSAPDVSTDPDCNNGTPDDYLHPERFINEDGTLKCADGVVIFDHQIAPKFRRTIIPYIENSEGVAIDLNDVDFHITLLETGETVVYQDIFNWYENGERTIFNTNKLLWERWRDYIGEHDTYSFGVSMIHRPTDTDISVLFKDHTTMTLRFDGLE